MAAIYLFSEALTTQQICAMHRLGPGYKVIHVEYNSNSSGVSLFLAFVANCRNRLHITPFEKNVDAFLNYFLISIEFVIAKFAIFC